jgi:hypothetical protein
MYVHMYAWTYVCMYIWMHEHMYAWTYVCMYIWMYEHMYAWTYVCMYICMNICMHEHMYACIFAWTYVLQLIPTSLVFSNWAQCYNHYYRRYSPIFCKNGIFRINQCYILFFFCLKAEHNLSQYHQYFR